ncbi:dTDP-4-dehydrorhamnose reductase [Isoptericola variabilis]|uniref:dTDP-4-dehydrorhamnose reductase n=1 Tax=Isoptericola variabilis (strain 225) TaxID=743718 RepID=F6FS13_ISOV2|nr:dTDP-4-dehydrorhamnose reductase [Isoptericola variabilis]AEG45110.1 dTDP-4-dehydrorhamnose reductase [Isoptericola variabilis 225]TWH32248.1 dTDP-4-dehydrorhamnose reductase [Isoptericola variabilis J7]
MSDTAETTVTDDLRGRRWLVVGAGGMLGQDVVAAARAAGAEVVGAARADIDVTSADATARAAEGFDVVVNCAAWTAVDDAETQEPAAFAVNAVGAANVARAAARAGARVVHVSTDYVFDGRATAPYAEDAPVAPRSAYGRTKAAGEWAVRAEAPDHLVVRTAWLYGAGGPCFPKTMARLGADRDLLTVVHDQVGQPTWTVDLADLVVRLVAAGAPAGTYHGTSSGSASWFEFTERIVASAGLDVRVEPTTSDAFVRPAPRPAYSVLGHDALLAAGVEPIADWADRWDVAAETVLGRP